MRRRVLPGVLAGALVLAFSAACSGSGGGGGGGGKAESSFSVQIGEPQHLIPGNDSELYGIQVIRTVFTGLVDFDAKTHEPKNMMAQSITSTDQKVWTIKIKKGWKFQNGEPVTAQSYIDSWNYTAYAPNGFANNYFFANIKGYDAMNPEKGKPTAKQLTGLKKVDDYTLQVTLTSPFSQFPITLGYSGFFPMPKVAFSDMKKFDQHPIGNGPYQMDGNWDHNREVKLKKYADYSGSNRGHVDKILLKIYSNPQTAYNDLVAGNLDQARVPVGQIDSAKAQLGDRFLEAPTSGFYHLDFPMYDKRYQNVHLHYAVSMAIDRKTIIDKLLGGANKPAASVVSPVVAGHRNDPCGVHCTFNPTLAKQELAKAGGWHGTMTLWLSQDSDFKTWMQAIANDLKKNLGITNIQFKQVPHSQYLDAQSNHKITGPMQNDWYMDYPSMQNYLEPLYATNGSANRIAYHNADVDKFIAQGDAAPTVDAGYQYYYKAEDQVLKDMPVVPLWFEQTQQARSERITNVILDPFGIVRLPDVQMAQ